MSIKRITGDPELWRIFCAFIEERKAQRNKNLSKVEDMKDVFRMQGRLHELDDLLSIKDRMK